MGRQVGAEGLGTAVAEKRRDTRDAIAVVGQAMGLGVVDHLKAVFEPAQKAVIGDQRRRHLQVDPAGLGKLAQCFAGSTHPQFGHAAAPDKLLGLGKEFDLTNTATTNLDIVPFDRDPTAAAIGVDLALDRVNVLDRGKVEVLAPDERAEARAATARPRRDHRQPDAP